MNTELEYLISKFLSGETTAREEQTLKRLLEETSDDQYTELKTYFGFAHSEKQKDKIPFDFREFTFRVIDNSIPLSRKTRLKRVLRTAAVVVVLIGGGLFLKLQLFQKPEKLKYTKEELREGLMNTQKALTLFTDNLQSSISELQNAGQISTSVKQIEKIKNIEFTN